MLKKQPPSSFLICVDLLLYYNNLTGKNQGIIPEKYGFVSDSRAVLQKNLGFRSKK